MRTIALWVLFLVLFSGCAEMAQLQKEQEEKRQNTMSEKDQSPTTKALKSNYITPTMMKEPVNKENMVHIVRKGNGTLIEFWVDLYDDDVKIDYEFDNAQTVVEQVELMPTQVAPATKSEKKSSVSQNMQQNNSGDNLQLYLASYEQAQRLTYEGRYPQALKSINQALEISPKTVQGWKLKGSILYKLNDKVGAKKAWSMALELDPYAKDVQQSLDELDKAGTK